MRKRPEEPLPKRHWVYREKVERLPGMTNETYIAALEDMNVCLHNEWKRLYTIAQDYQDIITKGVENLRIGKRTLSGLSLIRVRKPKKPLFNGEYWNRPVFSRDARTDERYIMALKNCNAAWRSSVRYMLRMLCETWRMIAAAEYADRLYGRGK